MLKRILLLLFIIISFHAYSVEKIEELSFTDAEITQVLKTISEIFGITIVPDKDVRGTVTRYFKDTYLEQTLVLLLEPLDYVYEVKEGIYFVNKKPSFKVNFDTQKKVFNITSSKAKLQDIINEMSLKSKQTLIFDGISEDLVNINIFDKSLSDTLKLLTESLNYELTKVKDSYYITKKEDEDIDYLDLKKSRKILLRGTANSIEVKLYNQSSQDLLLALFKKFNKKLSLLSKQSIRIPYLDVSNVTFNELLAIVFQHSKQAYTVINDVYYVFDSLSGKRANSHNVSVPYKLKNLNYKTFAFNIPSQIIPQNSYKIDPANNVVIIFGSPSEVKFYMDYIKDIDVNLLKYEHRVFKLKNIDVKKINKYLPAKFKKIAISIIEEQNMFSVFLDEQDNIDLKKFIDKIDIASIKEYKYRFKYLMPEDVMKSMLPNYVPKKQVVFNANDHSLIFNLTDEAKDRLFAYFDSIDIPPPVIRYQLLIVEYLKKNSFKWDWGFGMKKGNISEFNFEAGIFNKNDSINANFDIPTVFGHYFSAYLEYQLKEEKAQIQMSTEVFGLSGETVSLTSTQTLQYKDEIIDNDTNTTKPIYNSTTFGLNIEIKGRATSSNEVFLEVNARISDQIPKQGDGGAPDTSEKTVKNSVRTRTGKPIVLGGLTSRKENLAHNKLPGLAHIPYIGNAFKTHNNSYTESEFVIYIIPFIQKSLEDIKRERREYIKKIFDYFIKS